MTTTVKNPKTGAITQTVTTVDKNGKVLSKSSATALPNKPGPNFGNGKGKNAKGKSGNAVSTKTGNVTPPPIVKQKGAAGGQKNGKANKTTKLPTGLKGPNNNNTTVAPKNGNTVSTQQQNGKQTKQNQNEQQQKLQQQKAEQQKLQQQKLQQ